MESTVQKNTVEGIVNGAWKEYGDYSASLLMPK